MGDKTDSQYRAAAHRMFDDEGTCEIDENAKISNGDDDGAYVQAWVWVYDEQCTDERLGEDGDD